MPIQEGEDRSGGERPWIVVIGASAGGIEALEALVAELPGDLPAAIFVVLHLAPTSNSVLANILGRHTALSSVRADRNLPIRAGQIVVAKPDFHLLIHERVSSVDRGPRVSGVRPSIDVLFRSAAISHGDRVIGIVLSGTLDDGTAGLLAIRRRGGITAVQSPDEASFKEMPRNAIDLARPDYIAPVAELAAMVQRLVGARPRALPGEHPPLDSAEAVAREPVSDTGRRVAAVPSAFTCPECHGTLWEQPEAEPGFRCRVGHAWTVQELLGGKEAEIEAALWAGMRALDEQVELVRSMARHAEQKGDTHSPARLEARAEALKSQADTLRDFLMADITDTVEEEADA